MLVYQWVTDNNTTVGGTSEKTENWFLNQRIFTLYCDIYISAPARCRLLDFRIALRLLLLLLLLRSSPPRQLLIAVGTARPQLPAPASSRSQWKPLDLNNHLPISVGTGKKKPPPQKKTKNCTLF